MLYNSESHGWGSTKGGRATRQDVGDPRKPSSSSFDLSAGHFQRVASARPVRSPNNFNTHANYFLNTEYSLIGAFKLVMHYPQ